MGDNVPPADNPTIVQQPVLPAEPHATRSLSRAAEFLEESCRISMLRTHYDKYRRYVLLNISAIFTQLVNLYVPLFLSHWPRFKRYMEAYPPQAPTQPWVHATRIYVSAWVHDLYVSNREAVKKISPLAFSQHFMHEEVYYSLEYDEFLIRLNAAIRPTNIRGVPEDTLYIPLLTEDIDWKNPDDPFTIPNYTNNYDCFNGLVGIMKDTRAWKISTIVSNTLGRPAWLFDWHTDNRCCSWFPPEGNYNMEDVALAYIIGVACTPKLGPRDIDDWQPFYQGVVPQHINVDALERVQPRRFYGAYEVRTIEQRAVEDESAEPAGQQKKATAKGKAKGKAATSKTVVTAEPAQADSMTTTADEVTQQVAQFQISDWTYYHLVVLHMDPHTRSGAIKIIAFN